jgi:hypothetical protein
MQRWPNAQYVDPGFHSAAVPTEALSAQYLYNCTVLLHTPLCASVTKAVRVFYTG